MLKSTKISSGTGFLWSDMKRMNRVCGSMWLLTGEKVRLDLMELWKTGCEEKGGIVIYELKNTEVQSKNE